MTSSATTDSDRLRELHDRERIRELKSRYCRYLDTKQWDRLRHLFTDDCVFEGFGSAPDGATPDDFVAGVTARLGDCISIHHVHSPDIRFVDADHARVVWAMMDFLQWPRLMDLREVGKAHGFTAYGHYEEACRRVDGEWKLSRMRLTRLRMDPLPGTPPWPSPGFLRASSDWVDG